MANDPKHATKITPASKEEIIKESARKSHFGKALYNRMHDKIKQHQDKIIKQR